jgi:hypothetical protein
MSVVEPATGGGGPNRLFIVLALGLVGLLILGVVVIGGIFAIQQMAKPAPAVVPTTTRVSIALTTPTRAALVVLTPTAAPTDTPPPASPTLVVQQVSGTTAPVSGNALTPTTAVTGTVTSGTGTPSAGMPPTGVGEDLLLLAGGIVLVFVIVAARRARTTMAA